MTKALILIFAMLAPAAALAGDKGHPVTYDGGSLADVKPGGALKLYIDGFPSVAKNGKRPLNYIDPGIGYTPIIVPGYGAIRLMKEKKEVASIPPGAVTLIIYGPDVYAQLSSAAGLDRSAFGGGAGVAQKYPKRHFTTIGIVWNEGAARRAVAFVPETPENDAMPITVLNQPSNRLEYTGDRAVLFALQAATGKTPMRDPAEETEYEKAAASKTIAPLSTFMATHPESLFAQKAVGKIWELLAAEFPPEQFTRNPDFTSVATRLPAAIAAGKPFLVAFSPTLITGFGKSAYSQAEWRWTISFRELAGHAVTLTSIEPVIVEPGKGGLWTFEGGGSRGLVNDIAIEPFGKGEYDFQCWGNFEGSKVALNFGVVGTSTTFSK
jgi:hypothetical protein